MNPYEITGPALISFSGGRTSAYMLRECAGFYGGVLPPDVRAVFANTGKEREETLRFVQECGAHWDIPIAWVEWRDTPEGFAEVTFETASRHGEPFTALIRKKQRLPNWQERWCTGFLKLNAMTAYARSLGWLPGTYAEAIGLRVDEMDRVIENRERAAKTGRDTRYPLAAAGITKPQIMEYWRQSNFDLRLRPGQGNCNKCFLKSKALLTALERDAPDPWWAQMEAEQEGTFDRRRSFADLDEAARTSPYFPMFEDEEFEECGDQCAA